MCPCPYILHRGLPDPRRAGSCCRKGWSPPLELGGGCQGFLQHRHAVFPQRVVIWFPYRHLSAGSQCCHHCCAGPWPMVNVFHVGSWQLVLVCPRGGCVAIAVRAVVMWLCCAPFMGRHLHCHCLTPLSSAKQLLLQVVVTCPNSDGCMGASVGAQPYFLFLFSLWELKSVKRYLARVGIYWEVMVMSASHSSESWLVSPSLTFTFDFSDPA